MFLIILDQRYNYFSHTQDLHASLALVIGKKVKRRKKSGHMIRNLQHQAIFKLWPTILETILGKFL